MDNTIRSPTACVNTQTHPSQVDRLRRTMGMKYEYPQVAFRQKCYEKHLSVSQSNNVDCSELDGWIMFAHYPLINGEHPRTTPCASAFCVCLRSLEIVGGSQSTA